MKKREWIAIFLDSEIKLKYKNKEYQFIDEASIHYGKISNPELFIIHLSKYFKQHKLKRSLFGDSIQIINNSFWNKTDETITNSAFQYLGFSTINYINEITLFDEKEKTLWINCCETYFTIHYLEENYEKKICYDEKIFSKRKTITHFLKQIIKKFHSIKTIYLVGNDNMKELQEIIEKTTKLPTFLIYYKNNYFLSQLEKL